MTARSLALATILVLLAGAAAAQQTLVPGATAQSAPGWPDTSRTAQILRQQLRPAPAVQAPLGGAEAGRIYQKYLQGIGKPVQDSGNGYSSNSGFGSNPLSSGYGAPQ
jgi:hypothetical protein